MSKAALLELADRVEKASGPDRELDRDIYREVSKKLVSDETFIFSIGCPDNRRVLTYSYLPRWALFRAPRFTGSYDAAVALVPSRHSIALGDMNEDDASWSCLTDRRGEDFNSTAADPILATVAAALRARAQQESKDA